MNKRFIAFASVCLLAAAAEAEVRVYVRDTNGVACINYECTAGEVVRAFALDVSVDRGQIIGVSNYFVGVCSATAGGYGIFPAAFRDHITVSSGTNANWDVSGYTPLAEVSDSPSDTLPGLNSAGVTLEFGGLWDPNVPATYPPVTGTLCKLFLSETAQVSVTANASRGGVVSSSPGVSLTPVLTGALVDQSVIVSGIQVEGQGVDILFKGGELETAPAVTGPWTGTGNTSGHFTEPRGTTPSKFYRVRR